MSSPTADVKPTEAQHEFVSKATSKMTLQEDMAAQAALEEKDLTTWEALKKYKKASAWSMFVSLCVVMRAYDIEITGNLYALPAFRNNFGEYVDDHGFEIPARWQTALSMGPIVGQVAGAWAVGYPLERFGRKRTLSAYLFLTSCFVFMQVFAPNIVVLTVSMYLSGLVWGGYHVLAPTYASEVIPLRLRGILTGYVNLCYAIGQLLQTGITRGIVHWDSEWAFRVSFACQWFWPILLFSGMWWLPESPWWLIRQDRLDDAKDSLDRLSSPDCHAANHGVLAQMVKTDRYERELEVGATFADCFKGANGRRLEICTLLFVIQNYSGTSPGFAVYLFEQVGLSSENAFNMGIGLMGMGFVGTILCVFPLAWFGRRTLWLVGVGYCLVTLWVVGLMCFAPGYEHNAAVHWAQATLLIVMQFVFSLSLGPLGYVISSEVPSTRLRAKTLGLTATFNGISYLVIVIAGPYLLNPGAANIGAMIEFLWGGLTIFSLVWSIFRLPETANRTYEELDIMFERKVPARKFRTYVIMQEGEH